ncbi:MAG: DUF6010 family protein [Acidobacteriota bacterium]
MIRFLPIIPLLVATAGVVSIIPEPPWARLDDPNQWGVIGYVGTLLMLIYFQFRPNDKREHRLLVMFLAGMPVIYLADWLRFAGPLEWLWIELAGALGFWFLAWHARSSRYLLALGIAGHGVWDLWHHQLEHQDRITFVPSWYAIACAVIDFSLGLYIFGKARLRVARIRSKAK